MKITTSSSIKTKQTSKNQSPLTAAEKILKQHVVEGESKVNQAISIKIDQTLTQDATGTMAWLQFDALGIKKVKTECSVSYVDHNTLQSGFENADDHAFLQSAANKFGAIFSKPGNGICHQVHLEKFGKPGKTLLGSDSHTPTGGGLGMLAIGAGGLDVAAAMGGAPFSLTYPEVINIHLVGKLSKHVSAKDVILEVLRQLSVKGGVGKVLEYTGPGVKTLSVPERATITNMGAETGATTSLFPADEITKKFLTYQGRAKDYQPLAADKDAHYTGGSINIDLSKLEPLAACPHSPDAVKPVQSIKNLKPQQVIIGSCTNSSLADMVTVAGMLAGKKIHPQLSLVITPGSQQVLNAMAQNGSLADLIAAGARVQEPACGACIGMGQSPSTGAVTLRTFNRNFKGRSGTKDADVYLVSPETAAAAALAGKVVDPRTITTVKKYSMPKKAEHHSSLIIQPQKGSTEKCAIVLGPNIKPLPKFATLPNNDKGKVLAKWGNNITTDDIMPAGAKILPLRSNIPEISKHVFSGLDHSFANRAIASQGGYIIGGENYGQGSSREHAALAPRYLGIKAVIAKSFARIHGANLVNFGILPLTFMNPKDYNQLHADDELLMSDIKHSLKNNQPITLQNTKTGQQIKVTYQLSQLQKYILIAGGKLNYLKKVLKK